MATNRESGIERMLDTVRAIEDPEQRARAAQELIRSLQEAIPEAAEIRRSGVQEMRARGDSHADVAQKLGISRSAAQQIAEAAREQ
jgi:hypothetical protein